MSKSKDTGFPEIWFRGADEKEKEAILNTLRHNVTFRRLLEIVEGFANEVESPSRKDYDNPSWAYKQAHYNGEVLAYNKLLQLLRPKD